MEFNPGDILYRKYSDKEDLYLVLLEYNSILGIGEEKKRFTLLPYRGSPKDFVTTQSYNSLHEWFIKVDLNNYEIKDKFLIKIKKYLEEHLGERLILDKYLDNLLYIEILAELKQYENKERKDTDK